jgi:predicted nucleotidyltransferase
MLPFAEIDLLSRWIDDPCIADVDKLLSYDDALAVLERLVEVARARGEVLRSPIVLVGGTALAGWRIRAHSRDVDVYMPEISVDAVEVVEHEFRARHGEGFRLDVTTGENVWGSILLRDIGVSPMFGTIAGLELRALRIEDLFLLKLAAGRRRDIADLDLLAQRTSVDALVERWNQLVKWHGDRHAILGFADALVVELQRLFGCEPAAIIARLEVTAAQRGLLRDAHHGNGLE